MPRKHRTLADYLEHTGETQEALAERLGVTNGYISLLASGQRQPSLTLAFKIEELTGVPVTAWGPVEAAR